jgi:hypothetical protein
VLRTVSLPGSINVTGNPLQRPPMEIVEQGHAAVVDWWQGVKAEKRPLAEVKRDARSDNSPARSRARRGWVGVSSCRRARSYPAAFIAL